MANVTGSGVDAITRTAAPALSKALGSNVVVENQAGASGVIGLQALARSAPDGYTLSMVSNNVVIFPSVIKKLPFDMPGDFTPIALVGTTPMVLVVNPQKVAATNSKDFIAALKAKPDFYNFGSGGSGTILHLAAEMFIDEAKVKARHIAYKGVGPMVTDLIGGQIDFGVLALPSVQQHLKSGYNMEAWFAVIGPKGMSAASVEKVREAVVAAFNDPAVKEMMAKQGNSINISTTEHAQSAFRTELARYAALVKNAGIEPQ